MAPEGSVRLVGLFVLAGTASLIAWLFFRPIPEPIKLLPLPDVRLVATTFASLPGWAEDDHGAALGALQRSCTKIARFKPERPMGAGGLAGTAGDWRGPCDHAAETPRDGARRFFEATFVPVAVTGSDGAEGLFTGYYEPELSGSLSPDETFATPLYGRPDDLISVDLGKFKKALGGQRIVGRVEGRRLVPYDDRRAIRTKGLEGRARPLVWLDDPIGAFFIQIQGSGRVRLEDGQILRLGYAGKNGQPYFAIGRELIQRGDLNRENVSLQSIRAWLKANPGEADAVMDLNRSYVFFRELTGDGPIGAQGVALTPERSLAVDPRFVPLGTPIWLDTSLPALDQQPNRSYRRLMIAQDTGGAIRGVVRGDVFFGAGADAEALAGRMKQKGRYYLLLPRSVVAAIQPTG